MEVAGLSVPCYFRELGGNGDEVEIPVSLHDTGNSIYERFRVKWCKTIFTRTNNTVEDCKIYFNNSDLTTEEGLLKHNNQPIYLYINAMDPDNLMDSLFYVSFPDYPLPTPEQVARMRLDANQNTENILSLDISSSDTSSDSSSDTSSENSWETLTQGGGGRM
jgi:hypothetical protein